MNERVTIIDAAGVTDVPIRDSTRSYAILGLLVVFVLIGGVGAWSATAKLNGAIIAPGKLTVESNRKTVQHLEGGIISEILVRDGDAVTPGQLLMRLDSTIDQATVDATVGKLDELRTRAARLITERDGGQDMELPRDLIARMDHSGVARIIRGERDLFQARVDSRAGTEKLLGQRIAGYQQQIIGLRGQIESKHRQVDLVMEEHKNLKILYDKGYATLTRLLALERQAEQLEGEQAAHHSDIATVQNSIAEAKLELGQLERDFRESVTAELRTVEAEIFSLEEKRVAVEERLRRAAIMAPHAGVVLDLAVHTIGGVIEPGQPLLHIVPDADELVIEAQIPVEAIDKVSPGQSSVVRLTAFDQAETPEITGTVLSVSADRLIDEISGKVYYEARIELADDERGMLGSAELVPGMPAEVFIETGDRTALSFFVKPLTDRLARTFIEG